MLHASLLSDGLANMVLDTPIWGLVGTSSYLALIASWAGMLC
jgi:hypothetical protein